MERERKRNREIQRRSQRTARYNGREWFEDEDALVLDTTLTVQEIATRLRRTVDAVSKRRSRLRQAQASEDA